MPPMNWLYAVFELMMVPAAKAETTRGTRISRVKRCTRTSTKCAPNAYAVTSVRLEPESIAGLPCDHRGHGVGRQSRRHVLGIDFDAMAHARDGLAQSFLVSEARSACRPEGATERMSLP